MYATSDTDVFSHLTREELSLHTNTSTNAKYYRHPTSVKLCKSTTAADWLLCIGQ